MEKEKIDELLKVSGDFASIWIMYDEDQLEADDLDYLDNKGWELRFVHTPGSITYYYFKQ